MRVTAPTQVRPSRRILSSRAGRTGTERRPAALLIALCRSCETASPDTAAHTVGPCPLLIASRTTRTAVFGDSRCRFRPPQPAITNSIDSPTAIARIRSPMRAASHRFTRPRAGPPADAACQCVALAIHHRAVALGGTRRRPAAATGSYASQIACPRLSRNNGGYANTRSAGTGAQDAPSLRTARVARPAADCQAPMNVAGPRMAVADATVICAA